ncbi:MAG: ClpXP protease specificity-enhancing factor [Gammaproteobacteria bacterium]|nr:ClpXP protease specificity-enhancing factor [Gammaproteobacteria bacterium]
MTSSRPYLIRAMYEWLVDNDLTPYLVVDASRDHVEVPTQYIEEGRIVLNVGPSAVRDLSLANDLISFEARFGGAAHFIRLPPDAVLGVYARENQKGMWFAEDSSEQPEPPPEPQTPSPTGGGKPALKIVK